MPSFPRAELEEMVERWLQANRDWFGYGNAAAVFMEMIGDGTLSDGMTARMHRALGGDLPGHYPIHQAAVGLWEAP